MADQSINCPMCEPDTFLEKVSNESTEHDNETIVLCQSHLAVFNLLFNCLLENFRTTFFSGGNN